MPKSIKILWAVCAVLVLFTFFYMSLQNQMKAAQKRDLENRAENLQKYEAKKARFEAKIQTAGMISEIKELNASGRYMDAAVVAQKTVELDPQNSRAFTWWGISLVKMGKKAEAVEKFIHSARLDPNHAKTYIYWGLTLAIEEKYQDAIDKYENALLLEPENSDIYTYWGGALVKQGKYDEAIAKLKEALNFNSNNELAYGLLVDSQYHTGNYSKAWQTVARARKQKVIIAEASLQRLASASPESASR